jgi:hypothetical protein
MTNKQNPFFTQIAGAILSSELADKLTAHSRSVLVYIEANGITLGDTWIDVKFNMQANTGQCVNDASIIGKLILGENEKDEVGDTYRSVRATFHSSWRAYDNESQGVADNMINLIQSVNNLAKSLNAEFGSKTVRVLVHTAAEELARKLAAEKSELERKLAAENSELERKLTELAEYFVKGLRVGGNARSLPLTMLPGIPQGCYVISYQNYPKDDITYHVRVGSYDVTVTRTK